EIDGVGRLAIKEVLSYLGAKNGASALFGCTRKLLQRATNLQPRLDGLPWKHICATGDLTRYDSSSEQAMAVIKFATSYTQLRGKHVLKFFGSDGRDKGLRFSQDELLMLKAWHASVPTLTVAFTLSSAGFASTMHGIDGFGQLAIKEVLSYLGVSGRERFRTMVFELIPCGPGAKNGASVLIGCTRKLLQLATNLQPRNQEYAQGLTYKVPAGWSPRDNMAIVPHCDGAVTAREAVPYGHLKTPWHL
ncbi:unnamed protein product, partial [Symbiodinium necroappetens]